jgi:hypothetical protein
MQCAGSNGLTGLLRDSVGLEPASMRRAYRAVREGWTLLATPVDPSPTSRRTEFCRPRHWHPDPASQFVSSVCKACSRPIKVTSKVGQGRVEGEHDTSNLCRDGSIRVTFADGAVWDYSFCECLDDGKKTNAPAPASNSAEMTHSAAQSGSMPRSLATEAASPLMPRRETSRY